MHWAERKIGGFDFPNDSWLEVDVTLCLRHLLELQVRSWLVDEILFKVLMNGNELFVRETGSTLAHGLETFSFFVPAC